MNHFRTPEDIQHKRVSFQREHVRVILFGEYSCTACDDLLIMPFVKGNSSLYYEKIEVVF